LGSMVWRSVLFKHGRVESMVLKNQRQSEARKSSANNSNARLRSHWGDVAQRSQMGTWVIWIVSDSSPPLKPLFILAYVARKAEHIFADGKRRLNGNATVEQTRSPIESQSALLLLKTDFICMRGALFIAGRTCMQTALCMLLFQLP